MAGDMKHGPAAVKAPAAGNETWASCSPPSAGVTPAVSRDAAL
jgi:hypothetical protein